MIPPKIIKVDIADNKNFIQNLSLKQYEFGNVVLIDIYCNNEPYDVTDTTCFLNVDMKINSVNVVLKNTPYSYNRLYFEIPSDLTMYNGVISGELVISNGTFLNISQGFNIEINKSNYNPNAVFPKNTETLIDNLLRRIKDLETKVRLIEEGGIIVPPQPSITNSIVTKSGESITTKAGDLLQYK